jgi:hypothetical protein
MVLSASLRPRPHPLTSPGWADVFAALEAEPWSAYVLAPDLSLVHVNTAWDRFARGNGAPTLANDWRSLGPIQAAMEPRLQGFFAPRLRGTLSGTRAFSHTYECSSPDLYRRFQMWAQAGPAQEGIVVVHSLLAESPLTRAAHASVVAEFTDSRGMIVRCAACGRTRRPGQARVWEWAPALDAQPNVSTGICAICSVQEYQTLPA